MKDHYADVVEQWRRRMLAQNYRKKYAELGISGYSAMGDCTLRFFGRTYGIRRDTAELYDCADPARKLSFNTAMGIYHLFYYAKGDARPAGEWVPLREIRRAAPFDRAFYAGTLKPFSEACDGKKQALAAAARSLGFELLPQGDVGMEVEVFECMKLRLYFYDGDEEFPAQTNLLFDRNANDFLHEETVIMMGMELCRRLREEMR